MLYSSCIHCCVQYVCILLYAAPTYRMSHPPKIKTSGNVITVDWANCFDVNAEVKEFVLYKDDQVEYSGFDSEFNVYRQSQYESKSSFKLTFIGNIQRYTPITSYPTAPLYNIIIIYDTILRQKRNLKHEKNWIQQCCHISSLAWTANASPQTD